MEVQSRNYSPSEFIFLSLELHTISSKVGKNTYHVLCIAAFEHRNIVDEG